ncbi:MAG: ABC transporter permease [Nocardiopsaceae bacterium]|nr:ABC transporter permease [Nocardiopsaceae bacterium]
MPGTLVLARAEVSRLRRNRRYLIFSVALPVVLYLLVGTRVKATAYGVDYSAYYMVAMATFGSFSGALMNNSVRIAQERKEGWIRQLRLTPLPSASYVIAKLIAAMAVTIPSVVIVLVLGAFVGHVHMSAAAWVTIAVIIILGSLLFAALAVAIGYRFHPDQVQPIATILYFVFIVLGGVFFPLSGTIEKIGQYTPAYEAVKISTDVISGVSVPATLVAGMVVWLAIFVGLATLSVRSMAEVV